MNKLSISVILDSLFVGFITFLLSVVIFDSFFSIKISLVFSITTTLLSILIAFAILSKKFGNRYMKKSEQEKMTNIINQLCFNSTSENNQLFEKALTSLNTAITKTSKGILINSKNALLYPVFSFDGVCKGDLIKAFNKISKSQIVYVMSTGFSQEIIDFSQKFGGKIVLINGESVYSLLKKADTYPKITNYLRMPTNKFIENLKLILTKKRAKNYLLFGVAILGFSFITPYRIYYIVFGSLLLILSIVTFFFSKKQVKTNFY